MNNSCKRDHEQVPLLGGKAKKAEVYPMGLVVEILRGIRGQAEADAGHLEQEEQTHLVHALQNSDFPAGPETCQQRYDREDKQKKHALGKDVAKYLDGTSKSMARKYLGTMFQG